MFWSVPRGPTNEDKSQTGNPFDGKATTTKGIRPESSGSQMLMKAQEVWNGNKPSKQKTEKLIVINDRSYIYSVAFFVDGKHFVSCTHPGSKIRRWRVEDGSEVGTPMDAGDAVHGLAVSRDGKWIVIGTWAKVQVWSAETHKKVTEFEPHSDWICAIDVSPDATKIVTGSDDCTTCVWSFSGKRLLGPWKHGGFVFAAKFSLDGRLIATATCNRESVCIYNAQSGHLLVDVKIKVESSYNNSLAWANDSKQLFVLSKSGHIHSLDVSTGTTLSTWQIHDTKDLKGIALSENDTFIAASAGSSVSFWDITTQEQIGPIIEHTSHIFCMAISTNHDLVAGGAGGVSLFRLSDVLPECYVDDTHGDRPLNPDETVQEPHFELADAQQSSDNKILALSSTNQEPRIELYEQKKTLNEISSQLAGSQQADREKENLVKSLRTEKESLNSKLALLGQANQELRVRLADTQRDADSLIRAHEQIHRIEFLFAEGRLCEAAESFCETNDAFSENARGNKFIVDWFSEFVNRCVERLERIGDDASNINKHDEAISAYTTALSLSPQDPEIVLSKWMNAMLIGCSAHDVLNAAGKFQVPRFIVYRVVCNTLECHDRLNEALECFQQMQTELPGKTSPHDERTRWEHDFRARCIKKLENLGDAARDAKQHDEAIGHYSNALMLNPNLNNVLLKRGNEAIELNPSSYKGYEDKHAALHGMGHHSEALEAFRIMLSKVEQSPDPNVRALRKEYIDVTDLIKKEVGQIVHEMPRVLIDTATGRLHDKRQQAAAFEQLPIFNGLRSLMTTRSTLDLARIREKVQHFYRYVMFSHRWEHIEPDFQAVRNISVYDLEPTPENIKLKTFCTITRALGFQWLWSDTCCIDKGNNVVLQESLVAMFTWYRGSSLTLVYLRGVWSHSQQRGDLQGSEWNTRVWTYQEYMAAETVRFYTEDWKPYLGLDMFNHKESPDVLAEMEQASGVSLEKLALLRPGLERVREKLFLASMRQTTLVEDIAYSLLGIFNASIPVIYGEGHRAVGRLLEHVLTGSGDVTVLAWTGCSGAYNSCLPLNLTVYKEIIPPHVPQPIPQDEMDTMVSALRSSLPDLSLATELYKQLNKIPSPFIAASRLRLAGIVFPVTKLAPTSESATNSGVCVYHASTSALGDVEIKTTDNLSGVENTVLIHPWISPLLDQEFSRQDDGLDDTTRALCLVVRLLQPFGALLLAPLSRVQYHRVAADGLIMVQVRKETLLTELVDGIRTVDIQ